MIAKTQAGINCLSPMLISCSHWGLFEYDVPMDMLVDPTVRWTDYARDVWAFGETKD